MKNTIVKTGILCGLVGLAISSCNQEKLMAKDYSKVVIPPFETVRVKAKTFRVNAQKGGEFITRKGSIIKVPANACVDEDGNLIKGDFDLSFTEYNTLADVIVSGIPMKYKGEKGQGNFQSAGMFKMEGSSNGKSVFIKKGESIDVSMASKNSSTEFEFYDLNENGSWSYQGTSNAFQNKRKFAQLEQLKDSVQAPQKPYNQDEFFQFKVDYSVYEELKAFDQLRWKLVAPTKGYTFSKSIYKEKWRNVNLSKNSKNEYVIHLKKKGKDFKFIAQPISKNDQDLAQEEYAALYDNYLSAKSTREADEKRLQNQLDWLRPFKVVAFGICNWDTVKKLAASGSKGFNKVNAKMNWKSKKKTNHKIFHLDGNANIIQTNESAFWNEFIFTTQNTNLLFTVLPHDKIAVCKKEDFIKSKGQFELEELDITIKSPDQLQEILSNL